MCGQQGGSKSSARSDGSISLCLSMAASSLNVSVLSFSLPAAQRRGFIKVTQGPRLALPLQPAAPPLTSNDPV